MPPTCSHLSPSHTLCISMCHTHTHTQNDYGDTPLHTKKKTLKIHRIDSSHRHKLWFILCSSCLNKDISHDNGIIPKRSEVNWTANTEKQYKGKILKKWRMISIINNMRREWVSTCDQRCVYCNLSKTTASKSMSCGQSEWERNWVGKLFYRFQDEERKKSKKKKKKKEPNRENFNIFCLRHNLYRYFIVVELLWFFFASSQEHRKRKKKRRQQQQQQQYKNTKDEAKPDLSASFSHKIHNVHEYTMEM